MLISTVLSFPLGTEGQVNRPNDEFIKHNAQKNFLCKQNQEDSHVW